ncbi:MAG: 3-dehydroquinate synthase [Pseudomonadota bacterium]
MTLVEPPLAPEDAPRTERIVTVPLEGRAYDVVIGKDLLPEAGQRIRDQLGRTHALIVTDETVDAVHGNTLRASLGDAGINHDSFVVAAGESSKRMGVLAELVDAILGAGLERGDPVVALGGGVVGDLAGFAAGIARRGMPFVQIPTSLLAQVDSAVGGKTGVNSIHGKNLIGVFHQPALVLADTATLNTLPDRERRAGYAEIAKIAIIRDSAFFDRLERKGATALHEDLAGTIATAVAHKAEVVVGDERESGDRALLNLGHTFGHGIERCAQYRGIVHGEAVAIGLSVAMRLSVKLGLAPPSDAARVTAHLQKVGLPTDFSASPVPLTAPALTDAMQQDKKVKDGIIRFILARGIGDAFVSKGVDPSVLAQFLGEEGLPPS